MKPMDASASPLIIGLAVLTAALLGSAAIPAFRRRPAVEGAASLANRAPATSTAGGIVTGAVIIAIGGIVALVGLFAGLGAIPANSAPQQAVAALWVLCGLIGLLIAAIGCGIIVLRQALRA